MYRKEVNAQSPLRILEKSIHGGLGKGHLGVVMARAGVGKTACIVQIGLDDLMRDKNVLHVALGQSIEHVHAWYDALFADLAARTQLADAESVRVAIGKHRIIKAYSDHDLTPERLDKAIQMLEEHLQFRPKAILIDGFKWKGDVSTVLDAFRKQAKRLNAELWMTAQTHLEITGEHPCCITPPCESCAKLIDVAIYLEPHGDHVDVRLLKDHGNTKPPETHIRLHCDTMRLVSDDEGGHSHAPPRLPPSAYTLLSGGAEGAEAEFGACAERWGLAEITYSFEGRGVERSRGLTLLSEVELRRGEVSSEYLKAHMHRTYPQTPLFRKILESIWHQVTPAGQVFTIGIILPDNTVKGGTGWAAELGRHFDKEVHVYDQERKGWFRWAHTQGAGETWVTEDAPIICCTRFAGTGTRFLSDDGRAAISGLFARTFGR